MYKNNTPFISFKYEKQDYLNLNLSISSNEVIFNKAIDIFIDRICSRFMDQIQMLASDCNRNGFSIMALECLLIETFAQFENGLNDTVRVSRKKYVEFLITKLNFFPDQNAADKFYQYIRCGILHQAQTKPNSGLTFGRDEAIYWDNNFLIVSVDRFVNKMDKYFLDYCNRLRDVNQIIPRTNFIKKMNFICIR